MDKKIFFYFYNLGQKNITIYNFFKFISSSSEIIYPIVYGILFVYLFFQDKKLILIFFLLSFSTYLTNKILKLLIKRQRPNIKFNLNIKKEGYSFPSSHSSSALIISILCFFISKPIGIILIIYSILTSISRIILGIHYFSDIFFAWLIGILFGSIFYFIK